MDEASPPMNLRLKSTRAKCGGFLKKGKIVFRISHVFNI